MKKDIIYPVFLKCASFVQDTFWRYIYEDLSYGKCPYGLSLQKNHLACYSRGKEFSYKIDSDKPVEQIFQEVDVLLRERAGILSEKEKIMERAKLYRQRISLCKNNKEEWIHVKKKLIRDTLLEQYVLQNSCRYQIQSVLAKQVLSLLIVGLMFKTITAKDIVYQNGFITQIHGFSFEPHKVVITKDVIHCTNFVGASSVQNETTVKPLSTYWSIYLETMKIM